MDIIQKSVPLTWILQYYRYRNKCWLCTHISWYQTSAAWCIWYLVVHVDLLWDLHFSSGKCHYSWIPRKSRCNLKVTIWVECKEWSCPVQCTVQSYAEVLSIVIFAKLYINPYLTRLYFVTYLTRGRGYCNQNIFFTIMVLWCCIWYLYHYNVIHVKKLEKWHNLFVNIKSGTSKKS